MGYVLASATRLGNRQNNQDRIGAARDGAGIILILADGMGGHAHGELAANTLVDTVKNHYEEEIKPIADPVSFLESSIRDAHDQVIDWGQKQDPVCTPCTTCVVCLVQDGVAWWAHVGDSRLYLLRKDKVEFRTRDHSYVEDLFNCGEIGKKEMASHPMRNYVTQCIGGKKHYPRIVTARMVLQPNDVIMMCSDGLWGSLEEDYICHSLGKTNLPEVVEEMAYQAEQLSYPSSDNISVIAMRWISQPAAARRGQTTPLKTKVTEKSASAGFDLGDAILEINKAYEEFQNEIKKS
ncbi:MAG: hypothetical protein BMS9Abin26_0377 [Gammaproteobacteria bacterium]|nr:MAG: hypothetical protein BMS9Abin26_0377 [Gammaproteobacteria bacterium]